MTFFGILTGAALLTWLAVVLWRARTTGVDQRRALRLLEFTVAAGVAGASLPRLSGAGYSSFGGAFGALLGGALYLTRLPREDRLGTLDTAIYAFPFGWSLVRLACFLHSVNLGIRTDCYLWFHF